MKDLSLGISTIILSAALIYISIFCIITIYDRNKAWAQVNELEQSPDICFKCGNDIDLIAAEMEAKRIKEMLK